MSDLKEKLQDFVKEETQGINLGVNIFIFLWNFLTHVGSDGVISALFSAAIMTIFIASLCHFVVRPYVIPFLSDLFKR